MAFTNDYKMRYEDEIKITFSARLKTLLTKMEEDSNFLCELNYTKRKEAKQIAKYGGILSFKFINPSWYEKLKGQKCLTCVCSCYGKTIVGKGKNMMEAEKDLCSKLGVKYED